MKPKAIRSAIRERHPEASKKEIVRAAFYAVTDAPGAAEGTTAELHGFALAERIAEDNADTVLKVSKRKKKKRPSVQRSDRCHTETTRGALRWRLVITRYREQRRGTLPIGSGHPAVVAFPGRS